MKIKNYIVTFTKKKIIFYTFILLILTFIIFAPYGIIRTIRIAREYNNSIEMLKQLKNENDSLRNKIKELKYDTLEIERVAREKYGMKKPNEKVFMIKEKE